MKPKKYFTISELSDDVQHLHNSLNKSNDTICVLLAANFIDRCLANSLVIELPIKDKNFIKEKLLEYNNGVLATYSSRNKIAYSMNIIDELHYEDINTIGKIRNHFAHNHLEISFKDSEIIKFCNKLILWENGFPPYIIEEYKKPPQSNSVEICRLKFITTSIEIINNFVGKGLIHKIVYEEDL